MAMRIALGSERLLASQALTGKRVGVVCNPASIDHGFGHIADRVAALPGVALGAIFGVVLPMPSSPKLLLPQQ